MDQTPIRVAVAGLGWVALNRHIPQIRRNPAFTLAGVVDHRPGRAKDVGTRLGVPYAEGKAFEPLPWLDEVDAVVNATSPGDHATVSLSALDARKHLLTEKPFAMTREDGAAIVDRAAANDRALCITHNFQFSTAMQALLRDHEAGRLGDIASVTGVQYGNPRRRLPSWYEDLPLGLFYDESPHLIYLLDRLCEMPLRLDRVENIPSTRGLITPAQLNATFFGADDPRPFSLRCNFEAPVSEWYLMVCGTDAMGVADVFRDIYIRLPNDDDHTAWPVLRTSLAASWQHWRQVVTRGVGHLTGRLAYGNDHVYRHFERAIRDGDPGPIGGDAALRVLNLQHDVLDQAGKP